MIIKKEKESEEHTPRLRDLKNEECRQRYSANIRLSLNLFVAFGGGGETEAYEKGKFLKE